MPMSLTGEFLYFLMVAALYGSPLIVLGLIVAWRRGRVARALKTVALAVPLAALGLQLLAHLDVSVAGIRYDRESDAIAAYLGDPRRMDVVRGSFVGIQQHGGLAYRRYQFPSLDARRDALLEVSVPPEGITAIASIRLSDDIQPEQAQARLMLWPAHVGLNPAMATDQFFQEHFPGERSESFGPHTLIVGLRPRQSIVVRPSATGSSWRWSDATLELAAP